MSLFEFLRAIRSEQYWYLASAYSKRPNGYDEARVATAALVRAGVSVYSPIVASHPLCVDDDSSVHRVQEFGLDRLDGKFWLDACFPFLINAHGVILLQTEGWSESHGVRVELNWARARSRQIIPVMPAFLGLSLPDDERYDD
jgi:hypothetical protein